MIGVGKTTYATALGEYLKSKVFYEEVDDNPILDLFYDDPKKYGFALQIYFLNKRFRDIKQAFYDPNNVLDRSIYEDKLFSYLNYTRGVLTKIEYDIYCQLNDNMMQELACMPRKAPDLMIYLYGSFENSMNNINKRGRDYEQPTQANGLSEYYKSLYGLYDEWYLDYDHSPNM